MVPDWTDAYYGDLYLDSVADLLTPSLSAAEAEAIAVLLELRPSDRVLDLACGQGRHLRALAGRARLVGLDRSGAYLARARGAGASLVRGDLRRLPFRDGAFDAAFSWYASLFMWDDAANLAALREAARAVRPGGRLLVHHANPARLAREPEARAERALPGGGRVEETSRFDRGTGVDTCARRLVRPDGTMLAGTAHLRYYSPGEWSALAPRAGLRLLGLASTSRPRDRTFSLDPDAPDLVALAEKVA
ncbi:MAG TPA: class I SAM-dependent methyltransferase [Anaeromyxobacteraceae bacterium]|nr:class I SAM-dependent methyltransferase [Anaeromyxobacteraceae bacterium]